MLVRYSSELFGNTHKNQNARELAKIIVRKKIRRPPIIDRLTLYFVLNLIFKQDLEEIKKYDLGYLFKNKESRSILLRVNSKEKYDYVMENKFPNVNIEKTYREAPETKLLAEIIPDVDSLTDLTITKELAEEFNKYFTDFDIRTTLTENKKVFFYNSVEAYETFVLRGCQVGAKTREQAEVAQQICKFRGCGFDFHSGVISELYCFSNARIPYDPYHKTYNIFKCKTADDLMMLKNVCKRHFHRAIVYVWTKSMELFNFAEHEFKEYLKQVDINKKQTFNELIFINDRCEFLLSGETGGIWTISQYLEKELQLAEETGDYYSLRSHFNGFWIYPFAVDADREFYAAHKKHFLPFYIFPFVSRNALKYLHENGMIKIKDIKYLTPCRIKYLRDLGLKLRKFDLEILQVFEK